MKATMKYDHYYKYDEITSILKGYAEDYPALIRLSSLNTTKEGREIWLVEMTNTEAGDFSQKPAYFLNGHVHAGEVTGSMCAMYFLDHVLTCYKGDPSLQKLLDTTTFYVVPRVSPDGAELYLTTPETLRSVNQMYPFDREMPGVQPKDLDGDGLIRKMLVPTPFGTWKKAEDDPRVIVRRGPDDVEGTFYNVFTEGLIEEYDGLNVQQAPAKYGVDLNRNFPIGWEPESKQQGAGSYPLCHIESRSLAEFVTAHKNICNTITFHTFSGIYLYPPGMFSKKLADADDMKLYEYINKIAKEETGFSTMNIKDDFLGDKDGRKTSGSFEDFLHFGRGIFAYTVETWDMGPRCGIPMRFPDPFSSDEDLEDGVRKILKFMQENDILSTCFMDWTPFEHPQLGTVEIGGADPKYFIQNPPPKFLPEEVEKHTRFILRHSRTLPHVEIDKVEIEPMGADIYKVSAYVCNRGYLPTYVLHEYQNLKLDRPITVSLSCEGVEFLEGKAIQQIGQLEGFSGVKSSYFFHGLTTFPFSPAIKRATWIVRAPNPSEITIGVKSERAGMAEKIVSLA